MHINYPSVHILIPNFDRRFHSSFLRWNCMLRYVVYLELYKTITINQLLFMPKLLFNFVWVEDIHYRRCHVHSLWWYHCISLTMLTLLVMVALILVFITEPARIKVQSRRQKFKSRLHYHNNHNNKTLVANYGIFSTIYFKNNERDDLLRWSHFIVLFIAW